MRQYPLAVYTAEHGLAWTYPREEIDFASLDGCRKAFGRLPDFDAGESGFEGVWVTPDRVFAVRCMSVQGWDFRGRDATYLAVTWVSREEAGTTDFEALLASPALSEPTHVPQPFFMAYADSPAVDSLGTIPSELPDLSMVGALVAALPSAASAILRRVASGYSVQVRTMLPKVQQAATQTVYADEVPSYEAMPQPTLSMPARSSGLQVLVFVGFGLFAFSLIGVVGLLMQNRALHQEAEALQQELKEVQKEAQKQKQAEQLLWKSLEFPVPRTVFEGPLSCPRPLPKKVNATDKKPKTSQQGAEPKEKARETVEPNQSTADETSAQETDSQNAANTVQQPSPQVAEPVKQDVVEGSTPNHPSAPSPSAGSAEEMEEAQVASVEKDEKALPAESPEEHVSPASRPAPAPSRQKGAEIEPVSIEGMKSKIDAVEAEIKVESEKRTPSQKGFSEQKEAKEQEVPLHPADVSSGRR